MLPSSCSAKVYLAVAVAGLIVARWIRTSLARKSSGVRPLPGPPGLPVVGNIWDIPPVDSHIAYVPLAKKDGPLMELRVLGRTIVVVSDLKMAVDLLDRRGSIYSGRPPFYMAWASGFTWHLAFMPQDEGWRIRRKLVHQQFHAKATAQMHGMLRRTTIELARDMLRTPNDYREHIRRSAGANIIQAVYGIRVAAKDDPYVMIAEKAMEAVGLVILPGRNLIDTFPLLRHIPRWLPFLGRWSAEAHALRTYPTAMLEVPYARARDDLRTGTAQPCMVHENLALGETEASITEASIKDACAASYIGGADTTLSATLSCIMAMVLNPDRQRAAQAELDRVLGDRLPDFADGDSLPYIEAIVRETYRRYPVTPLGVPHAIIEDDVYEGFRIKKGSIVMTNVWHMMHDETVYTDPETFNPDRYLKGGLINEDVQDPVRPRKKDLSRSSLRGRVRLPERRDHPEVLQSGDLRRQWRGDSSQR